MRLGENPTKFARKHQNIASIPVKIPERITACTVTYVPNLVGYYQDGLNILRLTLKALRKNTAVPFDLMVFDNGSCHEVVEFLVRLKEDDVIQWLVLSSGNMKKLGAWNHLFSAVHGEYVYYFDSDIFHFDGWLEKLMSTIEAFPRAGVVGAFHNIPTKNLENNISIASGDAEMQIEKGSFISEDELVEIAQSLGTDQYDFVRKKLEVGQYRVSRNGVQAYLGTSHCQFLAKRACLQAIFPQPGDWMVRNKDKDFDRMVDERGWLRLTSVESCVYHLGNVLTPHWREVARRYDHEILPSTRKFVSRSRIMSVVLSLPLMRKIVIRAYAVLFNIVYRMR